MSDNFAIRLSSVGKMYKLFPTRLDNMLDALGVARFIPGRRHNYREFWALRDIDLELPKGARIGIIGRNGAGKSTLLKLITGNLPPTEGAVEVNGSIQALLTSGAGFNPEFTGYENMRAALTYQGLDSKKIEVASRDIAEFTELGNFLGQPFKNYSAGMQARLTFAVATTLKPDILIVDEVLGAGDAYFAAKSAERMKELVEESGASVLLVSHNMADTVRYCNTAIWMDRGKIVKRDNSLEVVKAYEEFTHQLEDRRLRAKNRKRFQKDYDISQWEDYGDQLVFSFEIKGMSGASCDISNISLLQNGQPEAELRVGDVQDADWSHSAVLIMDGYSWSAPRKLKKGDYCRSLVISPNGQDSARGAAVFNTYMLITNVEYACQVRYRLTSKARLCLTILHNGNPLQESVELPNEHGDWQEVQVSLSSFLKTDKIPDDIKTELSQNNGSQAQTEKEELTEENDQTSSNKLSITRWKSEGSLTIENVILLNDKGEESAVFQAGYPLKIRITVLANRKDNYDIFPALPIYRSDGVCVTKFHPRSSFKIDLLTGERCFLYLNINSINLGDGSYILSIGLFQSEVNEIHRIDLVDRSYEFKVVGNPSVKNGMIFQHPAEWEILRDDKFV